MPGSSYDVAIVGGLGRAGLPLGLCFAESGLDVVLHDVDLQAAERVASGRMPFRETRAEEVLGATLGTRLFVSTESACIGASRFVVVVVGTPLDEHLHPTLDGFWRTLEDLLGYLRDEQHLVLRSTLAPGTTERVRQHLRERGRRTRVSYCPERIAEGKAMGELRSLPQLVSSFDEESLREVTDLFSRLGPRILPLSPKEAELAKLFTNAYRYAQLALSNQFFEIALAHDVDFYRVHQAMTLDYPRMDGCAKAGLTGGPCLPKDTMLLAACSENGFPLGRAALLANEGLPETIVRRLKARCSLGEKVVGILGMTYKPDCDDTRGALSSRLKELLLAEARGVLCSDPFLPDEGLVAPAELIERSDIVVLATPHEVYGALRDRLESRVVVDVWNFLGRGGLF